MRRLTILLLALILLGCAGQNVKKVNPKDILLKSEGVVAAVNLDANSTFELKLKSPKFTDVTRYDFRLIKIGNATKIVFTGYSYNTTSPSLENVHRKVRIALKDAWILDRGKYFYVYTPNLMYMHDKVGKYVPADSLPRYRFLPIVTCLDVARFFDRAENISLVGENDRYYVISYTLSYPVVTFAPSANVKVWISKGDYIPVKAEITANYDHTAIEMITELRGYRTKGVKCDMSLDGLKVVNRSYY